MHPLHNHEIPSLVCLLLMFPMIIEDPVELMATLAHLIRSIRDTIMGRTSSITTITPHHHTITIIRITQRVGVEVEVDLIIIAMVIIIKINTRIIIVAFEVGIVIVMPQLGHMIATASISTSTIPITMITIEIIDTITNPIITRGDMMIVVEMTEEEVEATTKIDVSVIITNILQQQLD